MVNGVEEMRCAVDVLRDEVQPFPFCSPGVAAFPGGDRIVTFVACRNSGFAVAFDEGISLLDGTQKRPSCA